MRNNLLKISLLVIAFVGCKKSESTQPTTTPPQYSLNQGDSWLFQRTKQSTTDTTKFVAQPPTTINNLQFYPIYDTTSHNVIIYLNASDSIIAYYSVPFGAQTYNVFSRIIRASVNPGDSWVDSTVIIPDTIRIRVESKVDSTNLSITVPAGTFTTTKVNQTYRYVHRNITPDTGYVILIASYYVSKDVLFARIKQNQFYPSPSNTDYKLIKYQKAQLAPQ